MSAETQTATSADGTVIAYRSVGDGPTLVGPTHPPLGCH